MRKPLVTATAGLCAAALSLSVAGCSGDTKTDATASQSAAASPATSAAAPQALSPLPPPPQRADGLKKTAHDYIEEHNIAEYPYKPDDPGTPDVDFPFPPGWNELAKEDTPDWAYGGIIYENPADPATPPTILAIASKLVGDIDPVELLQYAPGMLEDLDGFEPIGEPEHAMFSGFESVTTRGSYTVDGKKMVAGEKTVVIPGKDKDVFVLQLQATALESDRQVVLDAVDFINTNTKITAP